MADEKPRAAGGGNPREPRGSRDEVIREQARELTAKVLRGGRIDPEQVRHLSRSVVGGAEPAGAGAGRDRAGFAEGIRALDAALGRSAEAAHRALDRLGAGGQEPGDNDLKETLAALAALERDLAAAAAQVAAVAEGAVERELRDLAARARRLDAASGARLTSLVEELSRRLSEAYHEGTASGLEAARDYATRFTLLGSGILAGMADALREQDAARDDDQDR
jgi:hypothetical protein